MNRESGVGDSKSSIQLLGLDDIRHFERDGYHIVESIVESGECDLLVADLAPLFEKQKSLLKCKIGGVRNLLRTCARVQELANSQGLISFLESVAGSKPFPVRAIFFDKTSQANWLVPWHQDLAIAVAAQVETPGYSGWSVKDGVVHVHPPQEILEGMVTLRLHLDDCFAENGALKVIPGSHRRGKLAATQISDCTKSIAEVGCEVRKGGALLMRPLLLHASSPAKEPIHRRVLHVEYATKDLANGLKWFES